MSPLLTINSQGALYLYFNSWSDNNDNRVTKITGCTFKYHELVDSSVVLIKTSTVESTRIERNCVYRQSSKWGENSSISFGFYQSGSAL